MRQPVALATILLTACTHKPPPPDRAADLLAATVQVEGGGGFGSGAFVAPHTVATAAHVGVSAEDVVTSTGERCFVEAVRLHATADAAVLRTSCPGPTAIAATTGAHVGDDVLAAGWPQRHSFVSAGIVAGLEDEYIRFTAPVTFGMSGGPVVDRDTGALVAIVVGFEAQLPVWGGSSIGAPATALEALRD